MDLIYSDLSNTIIIPEYVRLFGGWGPIGENSQLICQRREYEMKCENLSLEF